MKAKTFLKAIEELPFQPKKLAHYLADRRITTQEKSILNAVILLRGNKFGQIVETIGKFTVEDVTVESQRLTILGIAYNNSSDFRKGADCLESALEKVSNCTSRYHKMWVLSNLFLCYLNFKKKTKMEWVLDLMEEFGHVNDFEEISVKRSKLNYEIFCGNYKKAKVFVKALNALEPKMSQGQKLSYLFDKFDLCIKEDQFKEAKKILSKMKTHRKYYLSASYKSLLAFLESYTENKPFYLYENEFIGFPHIHSEVMTLKYLDERNETEASFYWSKLNEMNPEIYQSNFNYNGDKCIFSLCLKRALSSSYNIDSVIDVGQNTPMQEIVFSILSQMKGPVPKDKIFELVYGRKPIDKSDMVRLSDMISKLKKKRSLKIVSRKNCYLLVS